VADISHSLGPEFNQFSEGLIQMLGSMVSNANTRKELKPAVLSAFGDIASTIGSNFQPYLTDVFNVCLTAQNTSPANSSIEELDYTLRMRESVLDTYVGIVGGLHDNPNAIIPYVEQIFNLLQIISSESSLIMSESVSRAAVGLIGDVAQLFPDGRIKEVYKQDWITQFIKKTKANQQFSQTTHDTARWAREQQKLQLLL
jgi:importin subunit beta-1